MQRRHNATHCSASYCEPALRQSSPSGRYKHWFSWSLTLAVPYTCTPCFMCTIYSNVSLWFFIHYIEAGTIHYLSDGLETCVLPYSKVHISILAIVTGKKNREWLEATQAVLEKDLPFGLRSAPKIFMAVANALEWIFHDHGVEDVWHYLDDCITVALQGAVSVKRTS